MNNLNATTSCWTCLGPLVLPVNLFEPKHTKLLDILQLLLTSQVRVPEYAFNICYHCRRKLKWVFKFQSICLKSLKQLINNEDYKTEVDTVIKSENSNSPIINNYRDDSDNDVYLPQVFSSVRKIEVRLGSTPKGDALVLKTKNNLSKLRNKVTKLRDDRTSEDDQSYSPDIEKTDSSDSDYYQPSEGTGKKNLRSKRHTVTRRSKSTTCSTEKTSKRGRHNEDAILSDEPLSESDSGENRIEENAKKRKRRDLARKKFKHVEKPLDIQQYPKEEVVQAITDCSAYKTELKYRTCLYCNCVVVTSRFLICHMRRLHRKECKNWCARCNLETDDLQLHFDTTKCSDFRCNFCSRNKFMKVNDLVVHLRLHCRELTVQDKSCDENSAPPEQAENTSKTAINLASTSTANISNTDNALIISYSTQNEENLLTSHDVNNINNEMINSQVDTIKCTDNTTESNQYNIVKPFSKSVVNEAIAEATNFMTNLKFRKCVVCKQVLNEYSHLRSHMKTKHKETLETWCRYCNMVTVDLKGHFKAVKCNDMRCALCFKIYPSYRCLRRHLNLHYHADDAPKGKPEKTVCPICGKHFKKIAQHMSKSHEIVKDEQRLKCSYCDKTYKSPHLLKCHEKRHTTEKTITCDLCDKTFIEECAKRSHMRIHEGGPVQCTICNKVLPRPGVLKLHMRTHTGENKFKCDQCNKSYHIKNLLEKHMVTHSDERPHKCNFCDKRFKILATLSKHEDTHKGFRPFKCTFCNFSAVQGHALTVHMKAHPDDAPQASKPHKCPFCHLAFSTNAVLVSHTDYIHGANSKKRGVQKISEISNN